MATRSPSGISLGARTNITKNASLTRRRNLDGSRTHSNRKKIPRQGANSTAAEQDVLEHAVPLLAGAKRGNQADAPHAGRLAPAADDAKICTTVDETDGAEEKYEIDAFVKHA